MRYLDTELAALVLGCSERQVRRLVQRGVLTNVGKPRRILLDRAEVLELLTKPDECAT